MRPPLLAHIYPYPPYISIRFPFSSRRLIRCHYSSPSIRFSSVISFSRRTTTPSPATISRFLDYYSFDCIRPLCSSTSTSSSCFLRQSCPRRSTSGGVVDGSETRSLDEVSRLASPSYLLALSGNARKTTYKGRGTNSKTTRTAYGWREYKAIRAIVREPLECPSGSKSFRRRA